MIRTLWVLIVSLFEVLDDAVLANELLYLLLGVDVEGVLVEQGNLVVALALGVVLLALAHGKGVSPRVGVAEGGGELGVAGAQVMLGLGVI
jgi:hypothetical protein